MILVSCVYLRIVERFGCYLGETPIDLSAECEQFGDSVLTIWTDSTLARLASLDLNAEELVGCTEAIEEAFWAHEAEQCRVSRVRQQLEATAAE